MTKKKTKEEPHVEATPDRQRLDITIAGAPGAGKTIVAHYIARQLVKLGFNVVVNDDLGDGEDADEKGRLAGTIAADRDVVIETKVVKKR